MPDKNIITPPPKRQLKPPQKLQSQEQINITFGQAIANLNQRVAMVEIGTTKNDANIDVLNKTIKLLEKEIKFVEKKANLE